VYGTVRTVVWEDGGREAASYPIRLDPRMRGKKVLRVLLANCSIYALRGNYAGIPPFSDAVSHGLWRR